MTEEISFKDKIRSIGFAHRNMGTTRTRLVTSEETGRVIGKQVDHWNGRVDAVARPETVHLRPPTVQGD